MPVVTWSKTCTSSPRWTPIMRGQQADGTGPGDDDVLGVPVGPPADAVDLLPGLGHHAGGLQEHPQGAETRVDLDGVFGMDAVALRAVPVVALDAALGVLAVVAEVPFAHRAVPARHGVGAPDDAHDQVPGRHRGLRRRLDDAAQRLVAEDEAVASRRRPPVGARHDLHVGAAHPDGQSSPRAPARRSRAARRRRRAGPSPPSGVAP